MATLTRKRRDSLTVVAAAVLAISGCSASEPIADPTTNASAEESDFSEPTTSPTARPTARPTPAATPVPEANLAKSHQVVYAWQNEFSDYISYQVIIEIVNQGDGWAQLSAFDSDYQILDGAGGLVTTGGFTYAFPEFVGPGESAYLIADGFEQGLTVEQFQSVEADGRYDEADGPDVSFTFEEVQLRTHDFEDGYYAAGFVTADADVEDAAVAVVCLSADGVPLGATWTNLLQNLTAGSRKGFETVATTPPLDPASCAELLGFGQDTGF